ncbi:exosome complex component RRP40-like [Lytechinus variegatus]|uniref:exosome complex component RRP40-like n=1 Tax=Lytechinus variegatus TaxID=7654 RepID=UPI001BB1149A|nr:exosome complex component RRP40-like [Lytechinus variegatus]
MAAPIDDFEPRVVLPGDSLTGYISGGGELHNQIILGPGLRQDEANICSTKAGILRRKKPHTFWIDCHQKRYVPAKGDKVLGIVTQRAGDIFRVDIGGQSNATLSYLAFEGATKRNRPNVQVGDVLYAKLLVANRDMEPELVCIDSTGRSQGLGVVGADGFMFQCSLGLVRRLLSKDCPIMKLLNENIPYEIALGMNGRIWVRAKSIRTTIAVVNALANCEFITDEEIQIMMRRLVNGLAGF